MKNLSKVILSALMFLVSSFAAGMEVNILSERQEFLLKPFLEQFEKDTGIRANVVDLKKGGLERIQAQPGAIAGTNGRYFKLNKNEFHRIIPKI